MFRTQWPAVSSARPTRSKDQSRIGGDTELVLESLALQFGEELLIAKLKNRREAVFTGHRFYDFHPSVAWVDLFAGANHSRSL